MFDNFILRKVSKGNNIVGYEWRVDNPKAVILIVHGIGEYAARYDRVASYFNKNKIAVLALDLRGHGISMGKRGDCAPREDVLEDVDFLVEKAKEKYPNTPLIIYGHSMGGNITLDYRRRGTYNKEMVAYMVSGPWLLLVKRPPQSLIKATTAASNLFPHALMRAKVNESYLGNPKMVQPYNSDPLVHGKISLACAMDGFYLGMQFAKGDFSLDPEVLKIPMLLMHGQEDIICDIEGSRLLVANEEAMIKALGIDTGLKIGTKKISPLTYVEWEGYCHEIHNGGPSCDGESVILTMVDFISQVVSARRT